MYENKWTLSTANTDWINNSHLPHRPILKVCFNGSSSECHEHLSEYSLARIMPSTVDVTFRLQTDQEFHLQTHQGDLSIDGTLGVANPRGEYIVECEGSTRQILEIVRVANKYADVLNDIGQYELWIEADDGLVKRWIEVTLIFFSPEDRILRKQSLIPPGLDI